MYFIWINRFSGRFVGRHLVVFDWQYFHRILSILVCSGRETCEKIQIFFGFFEWFPLDIKKKLRFSYWVFFSSSKWVEIQKLEITMDFHDFQLKSYKKAFSFPLVCSSFNSCTFSKPTTRWRARTTGKYSFFLLE